MLNHEALIPTHKLLFSCLLYQFTLVLVLVGFFLIKLNFGYLMVEANPFNIPPLPQDEVRLQEYFNFLVKDRL